MTKEIGLRDKKKGLLRLEILETVTELMKENHFEDIKVKEICSMVNISEVTFFKYFKKKEDLLLFYMLVWNYRREMSIARLVREQGKIGIYSIFHDTASTELALEILLAFITYVSKLTERPAGLVLEDYEKLLLFDMGEIITPLSLDDQIVMHLQEAVDSGELPKEIDIHKTNNLISSIYYGTPLVAHMTGISLEKLYIENLDNIFNLKAGA
ncbi:MAG: TetR/AcrR family transcriptional regulator [Spirochaetales bacterium]|nr:TetR/AcrR family transcriptional regulator [Spirochaetales bacterium]